MVQNGRSPVELILKTVAIQLAHLFAWGHLLTLQGHSVRSQKWHVIWALLAPTLPVALAAFALAKTIRTFTQSRAGYAPNSQVFSISYYLAAVCGVRAKVAGSTQTVSLRLISPTSRHLSRTRESSDLRWFARFLPMLLLLAQCVGFFCQFARRIECSIRYQHLVPHHFERGARRCINSDIRPSLKYADSYVDYLNFLAVMGAFTSIVMSLIIWVGNSSWTIRGEDLTDTQSSDFFPGNENFHNIRILITVIELAAQSRVIGAYYVSLIGEVIRTYYNCIAGGYPGFKMEAVALSGYIMIILCAAGTFVAIVTAACKFIPSRRWRQNVGRIARFKVLPGLELGSLARHLDIVVVCFVLFRRIWMLGMSTWTFQEMFYCRSHPSSCSLPLIMWKDSLLDKLYTF